MNYIQHCEMTSHVFGEFKQEQQGDLPLSRFIQAKHKIMYYVSELAGDVLISRWERCLIPELAGDVSRWET